MNLLFPLSDHCPICYQVLNFKYNKWIDDCNSGICKNNAPHHFSVLFIKNYIYEIKFDTGKYFVRNKFFGLDQGTTIRDKEYELLYRSRNIIWLGDYHQLNNKIETLLLLQ